MNTRLATIAGTPRILASKYSRPAASTAGSPESRAKAASPRGARRMINGPVMTAASSRKRPRMK